MMNLRAKLMATIRTFETEIFKLTCKDLKIDSFANTALLYLT